MVRSSRGSWKGEPTAGHTGKSSPYIDYSLLSLKSNSTLSLPFLFFFTPSPPSLPRRRDKKAERFDKVAEALQKMETQVFEDRETLKKLSAKELWARCPKHLVRYACPFSSFPRQNACFLLIHSFCWSSENQEKRD